MPTTKMPMEDMPAQMMETTDIKLARSQNPIPNMIDTTVRETAVDSESMRNPWNADDLYVKAGNYRIYEQMLNDDQVSVAMAIKKDLVIGSGWQIVCESDEHQEIRKCLECCLNDDPDYPFEESLMEILSAYDYGFSVSEKQFKLKDDNSLTLKSIKTRNPVSWIFHQDKFGDVIRYEQQGAGSEFSSVDPNSIIHFINNSRFGNPYGKSDLRAAYAAYFIKTQIIKFYAIFLEKAASPIPKAKYDKSATPEQVDEIYNAIKKFQTSTAIVFPDNFDLDFLEASGDHGSSYTDGINMMNMFIGRALFVPDLLGFQGGPTTGGSQALGREQMVIFFKHIMRRRRLLENLVNVHIIKPIVTWNYGDIENYPKFRLKPIDEVQAERNARLWLEAVKGRTWEPSLEEINHFKKIIEFPETDPEEMEDKIEDMADSAPFPDSQDNEVDDVQDTPNGDDADEPQTNAGQSVENRDRANFAKKKVYDYPVGDYHKKTNFSLIENQLDSDLELFLSEAKPILNDITKNFAADIRKMNPTANTKKLDKLENLKLRAPLTKKLVKLFDKYFYRSFDNSQKIAQNEITKTNFSQMEKETFAVLPAEEFLATLDTETLNFIYDWEYNFTKATRVRIIAAIKDGLPIGSVIDQINGELADEAKTSIERYARTKFTEVMNKGRLEFFQSTGAVQGYQYAAVLDDRTTPICEGLHGKIFLPGDVLVPPAHWNCRSTLVPITVYEEMTPDKKVGNKNMDDFIDENIGKGFARQ